MLKVTEEDEGWRLGIWFEDGMVYGGGLEGGVHLCWVGVEYQSGRPLEGWLYVSGWGISG